MASKARDLSNFISVATIDASEIASSAITTDKIADVAVTHAKLHTDMNLSGKSLTFAADQISGNAIDGGVISNFTSTGIDDNATSTALTITSGGNVGIGIVDPTADLQLGGSNPNLVFGTTGNELTYLQRYNDDFYIYNKETTGKLFLGTANQTRLTVNEAGQVGIGTSSPAAKLVVYSDTTDDGILVDVLSKPRITLRDRGNSDTVIGTGKYVIDDFYIDTFSGNALVIDGPTRNVGIGTTSPFSKLHINSNGAPATSGNMTTGLTVSNSSGGTAINIGTYDAGGYSYIQSAYVNNADVARDLGFRIGDTEMLRLNSSSLTLYQKNYGTSDSVVHSGHLTRFKWVTQANDTWRTICSFNDFWGRIFVTASDTASGDIAEWTARITSPAYGVSSFTRIYYHDGGWNTGSFDLQYTNIGGTYYLQGKASSYYSSGNNFNFDIEFNKAQ